MMFLGGIVISTAAFAQDTNDQALYGGEQQKQGLAATLGLSDSDPRIVAANLIRVFLGFLGLIAVSLVLYAGWMYMRSQGNAEQIEKAKKILLSASIGLLIILSAFAIVTFVLSNILKATGGDMYGGGDNELPGGGYFDGNGGLYLTGSLPGADDMNVFRDEPVILSFNLQLNREVATDSNFSITQVAEYKLNSFETEISTSSTAANPVNAPVELIISTSSDLTSVTLKAVSSCEVFNGVSTTTRKNCLPAWSRFHVKINESVASLNGTPINCTGIGKICEFDFYTSDSFGDGKPVIKSITPAGGFCRTGEGVNASSTDLACVTDKDCQGTSNPAWRCDKTTPNAKAGNFVTISGRNFGNDPGLIQFSFMDNGSSSWKTAQLSKSVNDKCSGWSDTEIVAVMPNGIALNSTSSVHIQTSNDQSEYSNDKFGPKVRDLLVNSIERPGLCKVQPDHGKLGSLDQLSGQKLLQTWAYMGNLSRYATSSVGTCADGTGYSCDAVTPNLLTGTTSVFAMKGQVYSNFLNFHKDEEPFSGPMITGFGPLSGPKGQYVTIIGSGFGYASKDQLGLGHGSSSRVVIFAKRSADTIAVENALKNNTVCKSGISSCSDKTFVEGSFQFPQICSDDLWRNNQVIVKVPSVIDDASGEYRIYMAFPKDGAYGGWLITSADISKNTNNTNTQVDYFTASSSARILPGLCAIRPAVGQTGTPVDVYGENFPKASVDQNIYFTQNIKANSGWPGYDNVQKADRASSTVPASAITGAVNIKLADAQTSNPLEFKVGACKSDNECGSGIFCCPAGSPSVGRCKKGNSQADACFSSVLSSVFAWSFSTYLATSSQSCSGFTNANACMLGATCPNSPGSCQTKENTKLTGDDCSDDFCNKTYPDYCKGKCVYDDSLNQCVATANGTPSTITTCSTASSTFPIPGKAQKVDATCNEVVIATNSKTGTTTSAFYWQYKPSFGQSCAPGTSMAFEGWCTINDTSNKPLSCESCSSGFSCQANKCAIGDPVCPGNAKCRDTSDGKRCKEDFTCECCCKIGNDQQDCCAGLTCAPKLCVNGDKYTNPSDNPKPATNPENYVYGQCTGCTKFDGAGNIDQAASDLACSCKGDNRYCDTSPQIYNNGQWVDNPTGVCKDRASLGEPCSASAKAVTTTSDTSILHESQKSKFWQLDKLGACPVGSFVDYNNKCTVGVEPMRCDTPNATTTDIGKGFTATCRQVVPGINYWQIKNQVPCPSNSYLNGNATTTGADSWCTLATSTPESCSKAGATSTTVLSGSTVTCSQYESWYKPEFSFKESVFSTSTFKISQTIAVGMAAYYWQRDTNVAGKTYLDFNGKYSIGKQPVKCSTQGQTNNEMVPGASAVCHFVPTLGAGYWQIKKPQGSPCPSNTFLAASSSYSVYPWCTVGQKPATCDYANASTNKVNGETIDAKCSLIKYEASATNKFGFCAGNQPSCKQGLTCDPNSCTCQPEATTTVTSTVKAGELCQIGGSPSCTTGAPSCDTANTNFTCLTNPDDPFAQDCRCCCTPGSTKEVKDTNGNTATLKCLADKGSCSGSARGLFCGCTSDNQCNSGLDGCGLDTCCKERPYATSTYPFNKSTGICRNTQISITFNEAMDAASLSGNMILVGDYGSRLCPSGTTYLTTIQKERRFAWLFRMINRVVSVFVGDNSAYALNNNTFCAIEGSVSSDSSNKKAIFAPSRLLDPDTNYYVVATGDSNPTDALREGISGISGVGFHDDDGTGNGYTAGGIGSFRYASSSIDINNRKFFGYVWSFHTKTEASDNGGVCLLDKVVVNTKGDSSSWLFTTNINDASDDLTANFDTVDTDSDKNFSANVFSKENQLIIPINGVYAWSFDWSSQNTEIVNVKENTGIAGHNVPEQRMAYITKLQKDAKTTVTANAKITADTIFNPSTKDQVKSGKATVRVFACNNPWPPLKDRANWPWKDSAAGCKNGECLNNNFEFYYCRDAGGPGTADDLPVISTSPISLGKNQGYCTSGFNYNNSCAQNSDCSKPSGAITCSNKVCTAGALKGGKCQIDSDCQQDGSCNVLLKEFLFGRDATPTTGGGFKGTADLNGKAVNLEWLPTVDAEKYYISYGLNIGAYTGRLDVATTSCTALKCTANVQNLENGKTYYFTVTSVNKNNTEAAKSAEISITVKDTQPPAKPANVSAKIDNGDALVKWDANTDGDFASYKVYVKLTSASGYGMDFDAKRVNSYNLTGLKSGTEYTIGVTAIDKSGNESAKTTTTVQY